MPRGVWKRTPEQKAMYAAINRARGNTEQDFWNAIDINGEDECWPFRSAVAKNQYGEIGIDGTYVAAHRRAWEYGNEASIISGKVHVLHKCDYKPCCNPKHLYLGSNRDNALDRAARNRMPQYKLSLKDAEAIRSDSRPAKDIAADYNVCAQTIRNVKSGKFWNHNGGGA